MRMSILYNTIINKGLRVPFTSKDNEIAKGKQAGEGLVSGVARKFERWGKRSIFPTSGRGHVGVAKHCVVISF